MNIRNKHVSCSLLESVFFIYLQVKCFVNFSCIIIELKIIVLVNLIIELCNLCLHRLAEISCVRARYATAP